MVASVDYITVSAIAKNQPQQIVEKNGNQSSLYQICNSSYDLCDIYKKVVIHFIKSTAHRSLKQHTRQYWYNDTF
jgi:hypothetical protein